MLVFLKPIRIQSKKSSYSSSRASSTRPPLLNWSQQNPDPIIITPQTKVFNFWAFVWKTKVADNNYLFQSQSGPITQSPHSQLNV